MLSLDWLHAMVSYLLPPALWALLLACAVAVFDLAVALGERLRGLRQLRATSWASSPPRRRTLSASARQ